MVIEKRKRIPQENKEVIVLDFGRLENIASKKLRLVKQIKGRMNKRGQIGRASCRERVLQVV